MILLGYCWRCHFCFILSNPITGKCNNISAIKVKRYKLIRLQKESTVTSPVRNEAMYLVRSLFGKFYLSINKTKEQIPLLEPNSMPSCETLRRILQHPQLVKQHHIQKY